MYRASVGSTSDYEPTTSVLPVIPMLGGRRCTGPRRRVLTSRTVEKKEIYKLLVNNFVLWSWVLLRAVGAMGLIIGVERRDRTNHGVVIFLCQLNTL